MNNAPGGTTNQKMNIKNLTPHAISLPTGEIAPSGIVARVARTEREVGQHEGILLVAGTYGKVTDLPEQEEGVLLIVSALVRLALPERKDLASPARLVRDETGAITGCNALEVNP